MREAWKKPEDERRRRIKALRVKWHPDKHEVLSEMAQEVTKMINDCVDRMEASSS